MKKIILSKSLFFLILFLFLSCEKDELLRNTRADYFGDNVRIDGFYYYYFQGKIHEVLFLYRNGVYFKVVGDGKERTKPEEVKTLLTEVHLKWLKTNKDCWGIFIIESNNILLETWSITHGVHYSLIQAGQILNDTTFVITKSHYSPEKPTSTNHTYYFYPYSPKPDSTNTFIK